ncbi:MAG: B12-binding domain-containing radical SAM protein [Planctomycetes bacterium]|nr:B12-binding domain-containing radical SAM protein [Planctomycetota bacterium]
MRALLVNPLFPTTYWGFQHALPLAGVRSSLPPLGLITVAALLPREWQIRLVDLNIEPLSDAEILRADVVLVGGMLVQMPSMQDVLSRTRALERRTIAGGPAATALPDRFADADHVFLGEAEGRVGEIVRAARGDPRVPRLLRPTGGSPQMSESPVPRFDLLDRDRYISMAVQYSRGCPYACEFCDVVELFGRIPRVKEPERVLAELEALRATGYRGSVFFVDDNFIGNKRGVRELLPPITEWQEVHGRPFEFYTEASVNLASDPPLVRAMVEAGFSSVFVGIESPSEDALRDAGKKQNLRMDVGEAIDSLTRSGLEVMGGFIVGFDADGPGIFEAQQEFIASLPVPLAMVGLLTALPGTALWRRLESEGRLRDLSSGDQFSRPNFETRMGDARLLAGYRDLLASIYSPEAYRRRCEAYLDRIPRRGFASRILRARDLVTFLRAVVYLGLWRARRGDFWRLLGRALIRAPRAISWAVAHAIMGEHLIRYTREEVLPKIGRELARMRRPAPVKTGLLPQGCGSRRSP